MHQCCVDIIHLKIIIFIIEVVTATATTTTTAAPSAMRKSSLSNGSSSGTIRKSSLSNGSGSGGGKKKTARFSDDDLPSSAAATAAAAAGVPAQTLNYLSAGYLVSRLVYNVIYIFVLENRKIAPLRSLVWNVSVVIISAIWVLAGNRATVAAV